MEQDGDQRRGVGVDPLGEIAEGRALTDADHGLPVAPPNGHAAEGRRVHLLELLALRALGLALLAPPAPAAAGTLGAAAAAGPAPWTAAEGAGASVVSVALHLAADSLGALVQPLAAPLFAEHRAAGRPVVLATTTPYDLVAPLVARLGLDGVVATRYGVDADDNYDGTLDGPFVWSTGKLAAVREWAGQNGVDLAPSYAYRDRRNKKRDMRAIWLVRLGAALRENGTNWSKFASKLKKTNISLNRKSLSELAVQYPSVFDKLVKDLV